MQVDILFFSDKDRITIKEIKNILNDTIGISVNLNTLNYDENEIPYSLKLSTNKRYVSLVLELESKIKANASILSKVKDLIRQGKHRAGYKIVISYDESSMYFNEKLFSFISEHESKLRQLIYLILIDTFGSAWIQHTLNEDQLDKLKSKLRNNSKIIEKGLEAFSYHEYISFLFDQRPNKFTDDFVDQAIEKIKLATEINKDKLLAFLKDNKSYSLWESSFLEIDYATAEKDIELIRDIRNGAMHNKEISTENFDTSKKLIRKSTKGLDKAINYVKSEHSKEIKPDEVLLSLQQTLENIGTQYAEVLKPMRDAVRAVSESISKLHNSNAFNVVQAFQNNITNIVPPFSYLYQNAGLFDSIKAIQNIQQSYIDLNFKIDIPKTNLPSMYFNHNLVGRNFPEPSDESLKEEEAEDKNNEKKDETDDEFDT